MRAQATTRHKYIGEYWNFTQEEVTFLNPVTGLEEVGIQRVHYFSKKIRLTMGVDTLQRLKVFSDEPLPVFSQLKNITDVSGTLLIQNGVWQITSTESVLSSIGIVEGYRMLAKLIEGV